ncbi:MAG: hypothetical protein KC912_20825 [Proteobacteria bacterium]|nr:hypothetical protein [Pseudomonadota bacterium]
MTLLLALLACTPSGPGGDQDSVAPDTGETADTSDTATPATDESLVRDLIAGNGDLAEVLQQVAWSGGFPVSTAAGGLLFVAEGDSRTLAGDHNAWAETPMNQATGFSWIEVQIAAPNGSGYKFGPTLQADPWARSYTYDSFGELSYVRPPTNDPRLDRWPALEGEGLSARDLRVFVPPGTGPWPVLYVHDGQNLFDPEAIWGGWKLQEAMAAQPDMVLVGIDNTPARMDEYTHVHDAEVGAGGQAAAYSTLVRGTVRPHIEAEYGSTGTDGLLGSSLGGLVSLIIADAAPAEWDFVASMSGTLGWGKLASDNELILERWERAPRGVVVYVDSGGSAGGAGCEDPNADGFTVDDPDDSDNYCANREFADRLAAAGYTWDQDLHHWWQEDAPHNEAAWAARVQRPLSIFATLAAN